MKHLRSVLSVLLLFSPLSAQTELEAFSSNTPLSPDQCYELIKTVWDGLKRHSEEFQTGTSAKSEFESTGEYAARIRKNKDEFIAKVNAFAAANKLSERTFAVWMKADLVKYDADNQIYSVKSATEILVQPKKKEIAVVCAPNKYVTITEKNRKGYRFANLRLNTDPEFSWFVNKQTAQTAKAKEHAMFFKVTFSFTVGVNESDDQIMLTVVPTRMALMDQTENFTYWSEDIR